MKKTIFYLFPILLILSGCYIYRPYSEKEIEVNESADAVSLRPTSGSVSGQNKQQKDRSLKSDTPPSKRETVNDGDDDARKREEEMKKNAEMGGGSDRAATTFEGRRSAQKHVEASPASRMAGIKRKILPDHYYKITVAEREYKIQADQWEGDTLVSHILRKPKKVLKFHENQIDEELIKERVFSKPYSDVITVGSYAAGGAAILLLVL